MKERVYNIRNKRLVKGDVNLLDPNEILVEDSKEGVRLISMENGVTKDIGYNPSSKPTPPDEYEKVLYVKILRVFEGYTLVGGICTLPYNTHNYRYIFIVREPHVPITFSNQTQVDGIISGKSEITFEKKTFKKGVYIIDQDFNVEEVLNGKYKVINVNNKIAKIENGIGTLHNGIIKAFISNNPEIKKNVFKRLSSYTRKVTNERFLGTTSLLYKKNLLSKDIFIDNTVSSIQEEDAIGVIENVTKKK